MRLTFVEKKRNLEGGSLFNLLEKILISICQGYSLYGFMEAEKIRGMCFACRHRKEGYLTQISNVTAYHFSTLRRGCKESTTREKKKRQSTNFKQLCRDTSTVKIIIYAHN